MYKRMKKALRSLGVVSLALAGCVAVMALFFVAVGCSAEDIAEIFSILRQSAAVFGGALALGVIGALALCLEV